MDRLGRTFRDTITGFQGIATGYVIYISGCNQVLLAPHVDENGKLLGSQWFDEQRLQEVEADRVVLDNAGHSGFDVAAPAR